MNIPNTCAEKIKITASFQITHHCNRRAVVWRQFLPGKCVGNEGAIIGICSLHRRAYGEPNHIGALFGPELNRKEAVAALIIER